MDWTRERWARAEELFHAAAELPAAQRRAHVQALVGEDHDLCAEVLRLLAADGEMDTLLDAGLPKAEGDASAGVDPMLHRRFGAFRTVAHVADGGMGAVYRAERVDGDFVQQAAIKVLHLPVPTARARERFRRERQALARLVHPHIPALLDGGTTADGVPFLAMEFVVGEPLDRYCDARRLPIAARLALFVQICHTVHFAHQQLILHLDLKPANVLIDASGEPKLLDFGVASLLAADDDERLATATASRPLTPEYASPELLAGNPVGTAADVYALGVVLFELLTGTRPFGRGGSETADAPRCSTRVADDDSPATVEQAARRSLRPGQLRRRLRGDLDRIVAKALRPEPNARYASCRELADDVERHLGGFPVRARDGSVAYHLSRFVRRHRWAVAASAGLAALLVGSTAVALHLAEVARSERDTAAAAQRAAVAEALHARSEAASATTVGEFLRDTFLSSRFLEDLDLRTTALATIHRKAAQLRRQHQDEPHLRANLLDALGQSCLALDEYAAAENLLLEAAELRRTAFGERSLEYALSLGHLGTLRHREGKLEAARDLLREAYDLHRSLPVDVHSDAGRAANDLAAVERALGDRERARALHEEALALRRQGRDPLPIADSLNNLANSETDPQRAREHLQAALALRRDILGDGDPATLQALANLANLDLELRNFAAAAPVLREVVARSRELRALGVDQLAVSSRALAWAELQLGDLPAARKAIDEALALDRRRFGDSHLRVAADLEVAAMLTEREGDLAGATKLWHEVLRQRSTELPETHPQRRAAGIALGAIQLRGGDLAAGVQRLQALAEAMRTAAPLPTAFVECSLHLAHGMERLGDLAGAERALLEALDATAAPSVTTPRATIARYLVAFYRRVGRPADAAKYSGDADR